MMQAKKIADSSTTMTELVMPNDTNNLGNLMGGNLLRWMDICSAITAGKHADRVAVTAAVDNVSFRCPIRKGDIVTIDAKVTRAFNTSLEVYVEVYAENLEKKEKVLSNTAYYTFVALNKEGKPAEVPQVIPETEEEKHLFESALRRREFRLLLAKRIKPNEAKHLHKMLVKDVIEEDYQE